VIFYTAPVGARIVVFRARPYKFEAANDELAVKLADAFVSI
jgi:hypothetical protein